MRPASVFALLFCLAEVIQNTGNVYEIRVGYLLRATFIVVDLLSVLFGLCYECCDTCSCP